MNNFCIILIILIISCNESQSTPKNNLENDATSQFNLSDTINRVESNFSIFINKFNKRELPLTMNMDSPEWMDFTKSQEALKIDFSFANILKIITTRRSCIK